MKYITLLAPIIVSYIIARAVLWLINPNDPEGANLLLTTVVAIVVFTLLMVAYFAIFKRRSK